MRFLMALFIFVASVAFVTSAFAEDKIMGNEVITVEDGNDDAQNKEIQEKIYMHYQVTNPTKAHLFKKFDDSYWQFAKACGEELHGEVLCTVGKPCGPFYKDRSDACMKYRENCTGKGGCSIVTKKASCANSSVWIDGTQTKKLCYKQSSDRPIAGNEEVDH